MQLGAIFHAFFATLSAAPHLLRALAESSAPAVVTSLWQGLAVASALAICLRIAPRISAAHRFGVWTAGFVALVSLPFLPLASHAAATAVSSAPATAGATSAAWLQIDIRWSLAIGLLWAAASLWRASDLVTHSLQLRRLFRTATPVNPRDPRIASLAASPALQGRRPAQICTTSHLDRPSVIGFLAPRILIPDWLLSRLTPGELEQIVLHESEHLRRRDDWTNLLQKLCLVLFPLNPALWWIERRLCQEREMACDEGVVRITHAPRAYAACLTSLAERGLQRRAEALSLGAWQRRSELARRVHSLLLRKHALNPVATRALLGVLGCGLLCGSVELARCPQLIAFVPSHRATSESAIAQAQPLLQPASTPDLAAPSASLSHHATPSLRAKAHRLSVPARQPAPSAPPQASRQTRSQQPDASPLNEVAASASGAPILEAKNAAAPAPYPARANTQEWIVLTTWEQVQTVAPAAQSSSSDFSATTDHADRVFNPQAHRLMTTRFTVTRLFFRVLPVSSAPTASRALPMRDGWLVLQL